MKLKALLQAAKERTGIGTGTPAMMPGGASFAYVFGTVLVFLLAV